MHDAAKNGESSNTSIHETKYVCYDVQLNKQYHQQDYSIKTFHDFLFILLVIPELPANISPSQKRVIPLFSCRGGPPLLTQYLRGPPLV